VTKNLGNSTAAALGGGATYDSSTGTISSPSYTMYNANGTTTQVQSVGDAIDSINSQGIKYFHTNSTGADSQALGTNSVAIGSSAVAQATNSVAIGSGASSTGSNSVALGAGSTDGGRSNVVSVGSNGRSPTSRPARRAPMRST
jgi:autotransporter adhesin